METVEFRSPAGRFLPITKQNAFANQPCPVCAQPIKPGQNYALIDTPAASGVAHEDCVWPSPF